jgi:hypothetical protein
LGCENPKYFETLTPEDKDFPASILWEQAQSFWLHPLVFEVTDGNAPIRAADLALAVMQELAGSLAPDEEMDANKRAKEVHNLLLFLWAVKKSLTSKVGLADPPNSELLDNCCQEILQKLSPSQARSTSSGRTPSSHPDVMDQGRGKAGRRNKNRSHDCRG